MVRAQSLGLRHTSVAATDVWSQPVMSSDWSLSWFKETKRSLFESLCIRLLRCGPVPRHVAFIMDGNRRYARKARLETIDGHKQGFDRMTQMLEWCLDLGVREVTVYAFSIENFKRPDNEVQSLMEFAKEMFEKLIQDKHKLNETGKCVRVLGDLALVRDDIKPLVADIVLSTQHNRERVLNICFGYTSRYEVTNALQELTNCVQSGLIAERDINETLVSDFLFSNRSSEPDLLVRTSGETRLSDFLLWQTSHCVIAFANVLWPEFTIWDLFRAIMYYQVNCGAANRAKQVRHQKRQLLEDKQTEGRVRDERTLEPRRLSTAEERTAEQVLRILVEQTRGRVEGNVGAQDVISQSTLDTSF